MTRYRFLSVCAATLLIVCVVPFADPVQADPAGCQSAIAKQLARFKKKHLKAHVKCLKKENRGTIPGPCPDAAAQVKIQEAADRATLVITKFCMPADLAALNFRTDCVYESNTAGAEAACAALPVTAGPDIQPDLLAECLECWKAAELSEYIAILYPSHALGVCGGTTSAQSTVCSDLDCTSPLPDQRDLTGGEGICQHGIGKAGTKYLLKKEKVLEKCALAGGTAASCIADPEVQLKLGKLEDKKQTKITNKCGNRDPVPSPPFCCRTGMANACIAAADRDTCVLMGGDVQEDKTCDMGTCASVMGNKKITWWGFCPESDTCPGTPLSTLNDLITCVDDAADTILAELMCLQFRGNGGTDWPCPPSE